MTERVLSTVGYRTMISNESGEVTSKLQLKINRNKTSSTLKQSAPLNNSPPTLVSPSSSISSHVSYRQTSNRIQSNITDHIILAKQNEAGQDILANGDPMIDRVPDDGLLRLASNNINGSKMNRYGLEVLPDIDVTDEKGIGIMGLQETKRPWTAANIRKYNQQAQLMWPQGARNVFSSAPWSYDEKDYMAGGTLLSLHGCVLGRIIATGSDKWGRFTWATLRGARDEGITVINAYRTCHLKTDNPGPFTQYQMKYTGLQESGIKEPIPRHQILKDLTDLIDEKREQGFRPIVMMDATEDWVNESHKQQGNKLKRFMQQTQLVDPYYIKFGQTPRTCVSSTNRLDYILVDPALLPAIRNIG